MLRRLLGIILLTQLCLAAEVTGVNSDALYRGSLGPRALGFGGAFVAQHSGLHSLYSNPAGLSNMPGEVLIYTYPMLADTSLSNVAFLYPLRDGRSLSIAQSSIDISNIYGSSFDASANIVQGNNKIYHYNEKLITLTYAQPLSTDLSLGLQLKSFQANLSGETMNGQGGDLSLGLLYAFNPKLKLGLVQNNLISMSKPTITWDNAYQEKFAVVSKVGFAYQETIFEKNTVFSGDFYSSADLPTETHAGLEVELTPEIFSLRGGTMLTPLKTEYFLGSGLKVGNFAIDYTYAMNKGEQSDNKHYFSACFQFNSVEKPELNKYSTATPLTAEGYFLKGTNYLDFNNYDQAIEAFKLAIKANPNLIDAYFKTGYAYSMKDDYEQAIYYYDETLKLDPDYTAAKTAKNILINKLNSISIF